MKTTSSGAPHPSIFSVYLRATMGLRLPLISNRHPLVRSHSTWRAGVLKPVSVPTSSVVRKSANSIAFGRAEIRF
nr:hypothetical protein [Polaromonas sp. CG_9.7]